MDVREKTASEKMTEYVTLEQAATAFAIQTVFSTSDCLDLLHYAIQNGWISPSDVTPVRHGRWENITGGMVTLGDCSECKVRQPVIGTNYCKNCGAKMDGGAE